MRFQRDPVFGFTTHGTAKRNVLRNDIDVSEAHDPAVSSEPQPLRKPYKCIWDTGATNTVIRKQVADALGLKPSGKTTCHAVGSGEEVRQYEANTFLVNIYLPNHVCIMGVRVSEGAISGADVLIGMDIIAQGDFAISNYGGKTSWTFRVPSVEEIDFVKEINEYKRTYGPRNPAVATMTPDERRKQRNKMKRGHRLHR